jgi:hypothetical protein
VTATPPYHTSRPTPKPADALLDFAVDWAPWLERGDSIIESTWTPDDSGLVVVKDSFTATMTVVWLSGGPVVPEGASPACVRCKVVNHVLTDGGRQDSFVLVIDVTQS